MFSALFAAYAVLVHATAGGPAGAQLFDQRRVAIETGCLLLSSYTCGLMSIAISARSAARPISPPRSPSCFGAAFLALEVERVRRHDRDRRDAGTQCVSLGVFHAWSAAMALHVTFGLDVARGDDGAGRDQRLSPGRGATPAAASALFWHALDIIWVGLFTVVYLMGAR